MVTEGAIEKGLSCSGGALNKETTVCRIGYNAGSNIVKGDMLIFIQLRLQLVNCMLFVLVVIVKHAGNKGVL
jgi:hypothetical protein